MTRPLLDATAWHHSGALGSRGTWWWVVVMVVMVMVVEWFAGWWWVVGIHMTAPAHLPAHRRAHLMRAHQLRESRRRFVKVRQRCHVQCLSLRLLGEVTCKVLFLPLYFDRQWRDSVAVCSRVSELGALWTWRLLRYLSHGVRGGGGGGGLLWGMAVSAVSANSGSGQLSIFLISALDSRLDPGAGTPPLGW